MGFGERLGDLLSLLATAIEGHRKLSQAPREFVRTHCEFSIRWGGALA